MIEPSECPSCRLEAGSVATHCPEHGIPATVGGLCRCLKCCCPSNVGHNHPDYGWWLSYKESIEAGFLDFQARLLADGRTGRRCDPLAGTHSTPHVGCIMR